MSLIYCRECGKEFSDMANACPNCGYPNSSEVPVLQIRPENPKYKGYWSVGRMVIGIISLVFFLFISFQSCVAGILNTMESNGSHSGSMGFLLSIFMMISGIIGICTKDSPRKTGSVLCCVFYWLGALCTLNYGAYTDLPVWGTVSFAFGCVYLICAIKTNGYREL